MKTLGAALVLVSLTASTTYSAYISKKDTLLLKRGMTQQQVTEAIGEPDDSQLIQGILVWSYGVGDKFRTKNTLYLGFNEKDILTEWILRPPSEAGFFEEMAEGMRQSKENDINLNIKNVK